MSAWLKLWFQDSTCLARPQNALVMKEKNIDCPAALLIYDSDNVNVFALSLTLSQTMFTLSRSQSPFLHTGTRPKLGGDYSFSTPPLQRHSATPFFSKYPKSFHFLHR